MKRKSGIGRNRRIEMTFLEKVRQRCPDHPLALEALGNLYSECGMYEAGLQADLTLARLAPNSPWVWYNLACDYALLRQRDEAFAALQKTVQRGYCDLAHLDQDGDLKQLRRDPRWRAVRELIKLNIIHDIARDMLEPPLAH